MTKSGWTTQWHVIHLTLNMKCWVISKGPHEKNQKDKISRGYTKVLLWCDFHSQGLEKWSATTANDLLQMRPNWKCISDMFKECWKQLVLCRRSLVQDLCNAKHLSGWPSTNPTTENSTKSDQVDVSPIRITTWDGGEPLNNKIKYQPQLNLRIFVPSTVRILRFLLMGL